MKRTTVFEYEIMGSVSSWPIDLSMSRTRKCGLWTLYFNFVEPDAHASEKHCAETPNDFRSVALEQNMNIDSFCRALTASQNAELVDLAKQISLPNL